MAHAPPPPPVGRGASRGGGSSDRDPLPQLVINPHVDPHEWASDGGGGVEMELVTPTGASGSGRGGNEGPRGGEHARRLTSSSGRSSGGGRGGGNDKNDGAMAGGGSWSSPTRGAYSQNGSPHCSNDDDGKCSGRDSGRGSSGRGSCSGAEGDGDRAEDGHGERYGHEGGHGNGDGDDHGGAPQRRNARGRGDGSGSAVICGERRRRDNWTEEENDVFVSMVTAHLHMEEMDLRRMLARHFAPRRTHEQCANHLRILRNTGRLPKGNPIA